MDPPTFLRSHWKAISVWVVFIIYACLVIYILTGSLPPEPPEDKPDPIDGGDGGGGDGGSTDGGGGTPEPQPPEPSPGLSPIYTIRDNVPRFDVIGNIALFIPLGFLGALALGFLPIFNRPVGGFLGFMTALLISDLCEVYQMSQTYRIAETEDVYYNGMGAFIGAAVAMVLILIIFVVLKQLKKGGEEPDEA